MMSSTEAARVVLIPYLEIGQVDKISFYRCQIRRIIGETWRPAEDMGKNEDTSSRDFLGKFTTLLDTNLRAVRVRKICAKKTYCSICSYNPKRDHKIGHNNYKIPREYN